jgi:hypothetical protein
MAPASFPKGMVADAVYVRLKPKALAMKQQNIVVESKVLSVKYHCSEGKESVSSLHCSLLGSQENNNE